jgi:UDP-glucose 4-epimerase
MDLRYLVTGGAGFIGSHLCELLIQQGNWVVAMDDLSTGNLANLAALRTQPKFQLVRETIFNTQVLDRLISQVDIVIHLAAAVGVKLIVEDPVRTIHTNIMGTDVVLTTANRYGRKVLISSTSEVYGKGVKVPFAEDDDCLLGATRNSRWAYATSKAIDEFMGLAYFHQYGLPVVIMRLFNTIGPRQTGQYGMVIPRFVQAALNQQPLAVHGNGLQTRSFADVADIIEAIRILSQHPGAVGQVFNIGNDQEISILEAARKVIAMTQSTSQIEFIPYEIAYAPGFEDMQRRVPDLTKIKQLIGYQPRYTFEETIKKIIAFQEEHTICAEKK